MKKPDKYSDAFSTTEGSEMLAPGFCFHLMGFLWNCSNGWEKMKEIISSGSCPFSYRCPVHKNMRAKQIN